MRLSITLVSVLGILVCLTSPAAADIFFSTGNPINLIGTGSRPASAGKIEIESADDFILTQPMAINRATFAGLITGGGTVGQVVVEIYRVFPNDSDVGRTSGSPTFSTAQVPTRVNSPSDVEFAGRNSSMGQLVVNSVTSLNPNFTALNSVLNGINPKPNQTTGGEGSVTGNEVLFDVGFLPRIELPADHYFFVPQVQVTGGEFFWLSAPRPIVSPGTPFTPDLQSWIRNANLDPDWLRIGTDIVGGTTFNATFALDGTVVPEPSALTLLLCGATPVLGWFGWRRRSRSGI